jgi:glucosamine--fructose-6-phosphate aminotransferase (isomerizing)
MCGIIGVTGAADALDILLDGLERLEYRGYDSAGVALVGDGAIFQARAAEGTHSVASLRAMTQLAPTTQVAGIGHTRWATHGQPNETNAHPHLDCSGAVAIVHNGIIENHLELAESLVAQGHVLASETDTEVLAHLIEDRLRDGVDLEEAVRRALAVVRGAFALVVMSSAEPDLIVAARRISPLIVGVTEQASFLASDIPALLDRTRDLIALEDDQLAVLRPGSVVITDLEGVLVTPTPLIVEWDLEATQRGGYDDFMSKEMAEQPRAVADTLRGRIDATGGIVLDQLDLTDEQLRAITKIVVVACGSSYHAGLVAKYAFERWARIPTEVDIASEFRYRDPVLDDTTLVIGVSQSGETVDTLQAMRHAREDGAHLVVVSNVVDSSMAREADGVLYTRAGPEVCVASTKTVAAQMVALELLALHLAQVRGTLEDATLAEHLVALGELEGLLTIALDRGDAVAAVAEGLADASDFFFLGRHAGFPTALEGALKLKELSYLHAEGYPGGELKHGPIAVIEPGCVVVAVATGGPLREKMLSNVSEVKARGATVVIVAADGDEEVASLADFVLMVPGTDELLSPVVDIVPLQQLAYHLARHRGLDVDRPRNLAKTVTVE